MYQLQQVAAQHCHLLLKARVQSQHCTHCAHKGKGRGTQLILCSKQCS